HHLAAGKLRRGGAVSRRPQWHPADLHWGFAGAAHRANPHQCQCPGTDYRRLDERKPRARLSCGDDGSAYGRRTRPRTDLAADRRPDPRAWRLAAGMAEMT